MEYKDCEWKYKGKSIVVISFFLSEAVYGLQSLLQFSKTG